jgi:hypothetical protein
MAAAREFSGVPLCPYCNFRLPKVPQRKTKCPNCARPIYVKYTPTDPAKRLVTEARAAEIEKMWAARVGDESDRIMKAMDLKPTGTREGNLAVMRAHANHSDVSLRQRSMAAHAVSAMSSQGKHEWAIQSFRMTLEQFARDGFKTVEIRGGPEPCPSCARLKGRRFDTLKAKAERPVPNTECKSWAKLAQCCAFWAPVSFL